MFFEKLGSAHLAFAWLPVMTRLIDGATAWAQCLEFTHEGSIMMYYDLGISKKIINISIVKQEVCMSLQGVAVDFFFFLSFPFSSRISFLPFDVRSSLFLFSLFSLFSLSLCPVFLLMLYFIIHLLFFNFGIYVFPLPHYLAMSLAMSTIQLLVILT